MDYETFQRYIALLFSTKQISGTGKGSEQEKDLKQEYDLSNHDNLATIFEQDKIARSILKLCDSLDYEEFQKFLLLLFHERRKRSETGKRSTKSRKFGSQNFNKFRLR